LDKVTKIIRVTNSIKSLNYNVYLTAIVDDKIQSINRCELSTVIITVYGSCYLGGCIYSLDCIVGVITMLVFPACRYDESTYDILNIVIIYIFIYLCFAFVGLDNKMVSIITIFFVFCGAATQSGSWPPHS